MIANQEQPDLIAVTETWFSSTYQDAELSIQDYRVIRCDRIDHRTGGGVALYVKQHLLVTVVECYRDAQGLAETLWCHLKTTAGLATVGVVYRSPCADCPALISQVRQYGTANDCLIMGDLNAPDVNWSEWVVEVRGFQQELLDTILELNLMQHVGSPTRRPLNQQHSILDLVITPRPADVEQLTIQAPIGSSDHSAIWFRWLRGPTSPPQREPRRNFWKMDVNKLIAAASDMDWLLPIEMSVDDMWLALQAKLNELIEIAVPLSKTRTAAKGPPWFDSDLRKLLRKRKRLWKRYALSGSNEDYLLYKVCRNLCTAEKRKKREMYEGMLVENSVMAPKRLFSYIRRRTKASSHIPTLLDENGNAIERDVAKAELLAAQYASVYGIETTPSPSIPLCDRSITNLVIYPETVKSQLEKLDVQSAPGPDGIHPLLLRTLAPILHIPLGELFQKSLDSGCLPREWKHGVIKPMFKGGDASTPANYRPVTLTSVVGKTMERLVVSALEGFLRTSKGICSQQHGFTQRRSCVSNLLTAREHWCSAVDKGEQVDVIFIDFSKAFDRVPHGRLLSKLEAIGISGRLLGWIADFLRNRVNQVAVNEVLSSVTVATSGVPQGSVLGPFLFKIFVNDLPTAIHTSCLLFADDLKLWAAAGNATACGRIQEELNNLMSWSERWMLPVNEQKCAVLHLGPESAPNTYFLGDRPIKAVEVEKDLGVMVSSTLKSKADTNRKAASASRLWWAVRRSFSVITPVMFQILYASQVRPLLEYGLPASYPLTKGECDSLERVQRRATKMVSGLRLVDYHDRLQRLNLFPLEHRRVRYDLLVTRRIVLGLYGEELSAFFIRNNNERTRGHEMKLSKRRTYRLPAKFTLSTRILNLWNALPSEVISTTSEEQFKTMLDKCLPSLMARCATVA